MKKEKAVLFMMLMVLLTSMVWASSIGVSPGKVEILNILRGGYAESIVTVSTNEVENTTVSLAAAGEMSSWIRFDPPQTRFEINRDSPRPVTIVVEPPADIPLGSHFGSVTFTSEGTGDVEGRAGGIIISSVLLRLETNVTGTQEIDCNAGAFYMTDSEIGDPFEVGFTLKNEGNVRISPTLFIDVWNQGHDERVLTTSLTGSQVLPTVEEKIAMTLDNSLPVGQYWADLNVKECDVGSQVTLSVLEPGAIADQGSLEVVRAKTWASTNETIVISGIFHNNGPRPVLGVMKGDIQLDGTIVDVIETEALQVQTGESATFEHLFTPRTQGRYVVRARVVYNNKLTFEKGTIVNVRNAELVPVGEFKILPLIVYLAIFFAIVYLVRRIMQGRKRKF